MMKSFIIFVSSYNYIEAGCIYVSILSTLDSIKNVLIVTICQGILKIWILKKSSFFIVWMFFFLYGQSLFGIILIAQSAFKNARFASIMVTLIYFGNSFINNKVNSYSNTREEALIAGLISPPVFMI